MADYKELYYESQAALADIANQLGEMMAKVQGLMRASEEQILDEAESDD